MAATLTLVAHWRTRQLVWLAYVDGEKEEGNEEDSENE